jgi:hypothetical protein
MPQPATHSRKADADMTKEEKNAIQEIANSLQVVALLSTKLRRDLWESPQVAVGLEAAADKAVRTLRRLQPTGKKNR